MAANATSPYIFEATAQNFQQIMDSSFQVPILVDFWADWCQPCKTLMPILAKLANEYQGGFILVKVNSDQQQQLAAQFGCATCRPSRSSRMAGSWMNSRGYSQSLKFANSSTATAPAKPSRTANRRWKCTITVICRAQPS
ncbi:thioredoxin family protein [Thiothrix subterranea]|uniref:thioredoxin family protein n=1 Tax=Thiothrix subterranea TaxID=2735563 RepID=UPI00280B5591|nr:thioredoxin domain-containing protein [Thiothrix subterranea]